MMETQCSRNDEERRLLAILEAYRAEKLSAFEQLTHPRRSMLYPEYKRLANALEIAKRECEERKRDLRAYRKKVEDQS